MRPHSQFDAVVFDLGGVLIDWNPRYLFRRLFAGDETRMEFFLREVCHQHWNEMQDAGRPFSIATEELAQAHPEWRPMIEAYFSRWPEMLGGAIDGTVRVLSRLKDDGWPLFALTNWSAETFPHALERFEFLSWFDGIVVSGTEKMKKPEERFFRVLLERYSLDPNRCLFIDDVQHNLDGAARLGMHGIRFTGPEELESVLRAKSVL